MNVTQSYEELLDFIASGTTPESVVAFRPTQAVVQRVEDLLARNRGGVISSEEQAELDDYLQLEHLLILAKARARTKLQLAPCDHLWPARKRRNPCQAPMRILPSARRRFPDS